MAGNIKGNWLHITPVYLLRKISISKPVRLVDCGTTELSYSTDFESNCTGHIYRCNNFAR